MRICCVYMLSDPRSLAPKYVGATIDLSERLKTYRTNHTDGSKDFCFWRKELRELNLEPLVTILEECPESELMIKELAHYMLLTNKGYKLLNSPKIVARAVNRISKGSLDHR